MGTEQKSIIYCASVQNAKTIWKRLKSTDPTAGQLMTPHSKLSLSDLTLSLEGQGEFTHKSDLERSQQPAVDIERTRPICPIDVAT
jgi:hypothetical protein